MSNKEDIAKKHTTRVMLDRLVQDGGVEDMCSLFLMSTPESQLIAEQSLTKKLWNLPKKDSLHPKTKEKPQM